MRLNVQNNDSGNQSMGSNKITSLATPTADADAATKAYVDSVAQGLDPKLSVRAATTAALAACTYANGTAGVGATLTADANGALAAQDGITLIAGNRLLVKNQVAGLQNGIYAVTQLGSGAAPFILTRATDCDNTTKYNAGAFVFIEEGSTLTQNGWSATTSGAYTIGTTAVTWGQFSGAGLITAGAGLIKSGNTLDVGAGDGSTVDSDFVTVAINGSTLSKSGSGLKVADAGVTETQLATSVAGAGLTGGAGSALAVGAGPGITVASDAVSVNHAAAGFDIYTLKDGTRAFTGAVTPSSSGIDLGSTGARWDVFGADQDFSGATKQALTNPTPDANYTVVASDSIVIPTISNSTGRTLTLPVAVDGRKLMIKLVGGGSGALTITPNGAEIIDGASTLVLNSLGAVTLVGMTGMGWIIF